MQPWHRFKAQLPSTHGAGREWWWCQQCLVIWGCVKEPAVSNSDDWDWGVVLPSSSFLPITTFLPLLRCPTTMPRDSRWLWHPSDSSGSGLIDIGGGGGKFATVPVKTGVEGGVGYTLCDEPLGAGMGMSTNTNTTNVREQQPSLNAMQPPSLNMETWHEIGLSFSMSITEVLGSGVKDQPWAWKMSDDGSMPTSATQPLPPGTVPAFLSTLQCPTYFCRNPVIPVEFHRIPQELIDVMWLNLKSHMT